MEVTQDDLKEWQKALEDSALKKREFTLFTGNWKYASKMIDDAFWKNALLLPTPQKPKSMHDVAAAEKAGKEYVKKVNRDSKFGMGAIQEKDFLRGVQWMMKVYFEKNSILIWKKFSQEEPPKGTTILSRYTKDHVYDYSLMKYGDNEFKRSVLLSVDAEWSTIEATDTWYNHEELARMNSSGIWSQIKAMP